jgi:biopolymer transport protein ExbD
MNLKPRPAEEPEVNLVSLIDVVLMLVVFFMLSSTFVDENRLKIRLPEASPAPVPRGTEERLVVEITASGAYRVNDSELVNSSPETLRRAILRLPIGARAMPVTVRADGRASHQSVVTAMDVIGRIGFREINIATVRAEAAAADAAPARGRPAENQR